MTGYRMDGQNNILIVSTFINRWECNVFTFSMIIFRIVTNVVIHPSARPFIDYAM
jgi:hypothetical protein